MFCRLAYAAWATARLHSSRLRFSYSDAVCGSAWFCFQSRSWAMARRRPVLLRRMPRWRWLNACRAGRLNVFWRSSEKMSASAEGFRRPLGRAVWNACPSAMVWAASLAVTTHSSRSCWRGGWLRAVRCRQFRLRRRAAAERFCRRGRLDAAAGIVLHGADGDGLRVMSAALGQAVPMDGRKMLADELCGLAADVERDEVLCLFGDFGGDGAGNDVARREFGAAVVMRHKPFTRLVGQNAAFAAHGFGNQEGAAVFRRPCQACGVELINSRFSTAQPARIAMAMASPVHSGGVVAA